MGWPGTAGDIVIFMRRAAGAVEDGRSDERPATALRVKTAAGRWVIAAAVLGSGIVFIDSTVVNIALPTIGRDFGVGLAALQWTVTAYTLTLSALILIGGSLGGSDAGECS